MRRFELFEPKSIRETWSNLPICEMLKLAAGARLIIDESVIEELEREGFFKKLPAERQS